MFRICKSLLLSVLVMAAGLAACQTAPVPTPAMTPTPVTGVAPVNDIKMYYEIHGEGTPLILLPGGLGDTNDWEKQIPALSTQYKVIAVDTRGHGRSTFTDQPISYKLMASDVVALMNYLNIQKANILGWSDGAIIGLDLAINHPDRLNKVIAYGANYNLSGLRPVPSDTAKFEAEMEKAAKEYQTLSPDPTRWGVFQQNMFNMWASEPNYTAEQLGSITVPMLILDGEHDEIIYPDHTKEMARLIPTAALTLIPDTGHFAPWEKPEEFNKIVLDFLSK